MKMCIFLFKCHLLGHNWTKNILTGQLFRFFFLFTELIVYFLILTLIFLAFLMSIEMTLVWWVCPVFVNVAGWQFTDHTRDFNWNLRVIYEAFEMDVIGEVSISKRQE